MSTRTNPPTRPTVETLWIDDNGRCSCTAHSGHYVQALAPEHPTPGGMLFTPRGSYLAIDADLAAQTGGDDLTCETCQAGLATPEGTTR